MNFRTLTEALDAAAGRPGAGFSHLTEDRQPIRAVPYSDLAVSARRFAAGLQRYGLRPGDRVGLILPESADFIEAIFGCMYAGLIAVPIYPPLNPGQMGTYLANTAHILQRAGCRLLVTDGRVRPVLGTLLEGVPSLRGIEDRAGLLGGATDFREVPVRGDDVAFLQFTSGSTSSPKGVTLTHANLLANVDAIGGALGLGWHEDGPGVSWLPLYHDMGLIGFVFAGVRFAASRLLFMSPLLFLKRPALWLRQLSAWQARVTFAPNFAYGLCAHRVKDSEIEGIDLSALRVAGCGAEPIQRATLDAFAARYAPAGFSRRALLPCYGMAEHTLAVSFIGLDEELKAERVDPAVLAEGRAEPVAEGGVEVVSCGRPLPGHAIRVVDPEGEPLPEGQVGQIALSGPSVMRGYWDDPERTAAALRGGWLSTGDLGYLRGGELFVCGRIKDLIIVQGRNFHPTDLEWQASQVEGVRRGNVVAFGLPDEGRERVIIAAEVREVADPERLRAEVVARVLEGLALRVDEVLLLAPGSLPKTSSGKLQRARTAVLYAEGRLGGGGEGRVGLLKRLTASQWSHFKARFARRDGE